MKKIVSIKTISELKAIFGLQNLFLIFEIKLEIPQLTEEEAAFYKNKLQE